LNAYKFLIDFQTRKHTNETNSFNNFRVIHKIHFCKLKQRITMHSALLLISSHAKCIVVTACVGSFNKQMSGFW